MKRILLLSFLFVSLTLSAWERTPLWPDGKMPNKQDHQIAEMTNVSRLKDFNPDAFRVPYLEWFEAPSPEKKNGACIILISGGSYMDCCDVKLIESWHRDLTALGFQCVNFVYRTPRPKNLPIYLTAWQDGQRAVRMVRSEAARRGYDPEKIGVFSMSAGSHLALMLGTSSQTPAYDPIDALDATPCHINWAVVHAPAYVTTDGEKGTAATRGGYGVDVTLSKVFRFDEKTCPMSLHHGGTDPYSPNGSTLIYRELRKLGIPAELHLYPNKAHGAFGFERGVEFMRQMGFMGTLEKEVPILNRFPNDDDRGKYIKMDVWPSAQKTPDFQAHQCTPYIEWHFPKELKSKAIQIVYSGGGYDTNDPDGASPTSVRRFLNSKGVTVVTMKYRTPRPQGLAKHTNAWQDLQRAIRLVRSLAPEYGLDSERIGIMGSSAGGHLTLMGVTSSCHPAYYRVDKTIDKLPCHVAWGVAVYPAYVLKDGDNGHNHHGGNLDEDVIVDDFSFDLKTAPTLFLHGDADPYASMGSVKVWEKMRAMGVQSELHTYATRVHGFHKSGAPGTGSYTWMERLEEFLAPFLKD